MRCDGCELLVIDVDRHHRGTEGARHLNAVAANAAGANHHRQTAGCDAGATHGLVRRGECVGDDGDLRQIQTDGGKALFVDFAQATTGHHDMRRKTTLNVVAGHFLCAADRLQSALAQITFTAGQHGRNDHRFAEPGLGASAGCHHVTADLVPQGQGRCDVGSYAIVVIAQIGVTDAAAGNRHHHFSGRGYRAEGNPLERFAGLVHLPTVGRDAHVLSPAQRWTDGNFRNCRILVPNYHQCQKNF